MTKIPEDVLKAAREAYLTVPTTPTDAWFVKSVREGDYDHQMPIKASARAILAERERCATIAVGMRGSYGGLVGAPDSGAFGFDAACWQIADSIRGGSNA